MTDQLFKQVGAFAANVPNLTNRAVVDAAGSSVDTIYAEAVLASMPTLVVEKYNLMRTKEWEGPEDSVTFPVWKHLDLNWTNISGTGSDTGSDLAITQSPATTWRKITPVMYGAGLFIHDMVDISVNKHNFDDFARRGGVAVQRYIDRKAILDGIMACENSWATGSNLYVAGASALTSGSISTASTLTPRNILEAQKILSTGRNSVSGNGSDIYKPDVVLMHENQYFQLITHADFSETQTTEVRRFAVWEAGRLVRFSNMDIVVTELVSGGEQQNSSFAGYYTSSGANIGRPVAVFNKAVTAAMAKKTAGFRVRTWEDPLKHGKYKLFDVMFQAEPLIPESCLIIRCSD